MDNKIKTSTGEKIFQVINYILLSFVILVTIYPVFYVVVASLSDGDLLLANSGMLWRPLGFSFDAYVKVFQNDRIISGYGVTLLVVAIGTTLNVVLSIFAAYFVSKKTIYARNFVMFFMMLTMYFSGGTVPLYLTVKQLGLYDTLFALILPGAVSVYNVIVLRTAFTAVPDSMEEAARIDGANTFTVLFQILVPLIKATLAVIMLYYLVGHWNSWFHASIFLQNEKLFPLQLVLRDILIENSNEELMIGVDTDSAYSVAESIKYAVIVVSVLPMMILYPFLQKYFAKGVMIGAVKG